MPGQNGKAALACVQTLLPERVPSVLCVVFPCQGIVFSDEFQNLVECVLRGARALACRATAFCYWVDFVQGGPEGSLDHRSPLPWSGSHPLVPSLETYLHARRARSQETHSHPVWPKN